jgi:hypothetical protein
MSAEEGQWRPLIDAYARVVAINDDETSMVQHRVVSARLADANGTSGTAGYITLDWPPTWRPPQIGEQLLISVRARIDL